jgi:septal ring factor EnvC (AmiA/AmiB activator)
MIARAAIAIVLSLAAPASAQTAASIETIEREIADKERAIEEAGARRDRVGAEIDGLVAQRGAAQRRMRVRVRALYRMRRAGALPLAGGFDALIRHQSRIERLERMVERDVGSLRTLSRRVSALQSETARLATEVETFEREASSLRQQKAMLERATIGMWAGVLPQPPHALPEPQWNEGFGMRLSQEPERPRFDALRGRLPMPVAGTARMGDATREGGEGVELAGAAGLSVRAVAPGTISYAAPHPSYGSLVIVDHGDSYYSVYGGLGMTSVRVGQPIAANGPIGSLGAAPLFFQVRRGTRPLPPREWLGL